jgi:hypothetical protein
MINDASLKSQLFMGWVSWPWIYVIAWYIVIQELDVYPLRNESHPIRFWWKIADSNRECVLGETRVADSKVWV